MPVDRRPEGIAAWEATLRRLARAPNVTVKLSGFGLGHPRWTVGDTAPLLRLAIEIFGPERAMVGTNLPVDLLFAPTAQIFVAMATAVEGLTETEQTAVLRGTAARVYRL